MKVYFQHVLLLIISLSISIIACAQKTKPFSNGEKLVYIAHLGWLNAGEATFTLYDTVYKSQVAYHAVAKANTIGLADKIYKVRDVYESIFDKKTGLPFLAIRNISEGNYTYYNEVEYDHSQNKVISQKSGEHEVPKNILDMVSAFYHFRESMVKQIKNIGDEIVIDTYFADEIFPLKMKYVGIERIKTKMGKFNCLKFSPVVEPGRIFDSEDDVTIWISNDKNYIPLQVRIDLIVGSIKCDLVEYSGIKHPINQLD